MHRPLTVENGANAAESALFDRVASVLFSAPPASPSVAYDFSPYNLSYVLRFQSCTPPTNCLTSIRCFTRILCVTLAMSFDRSASAPTHDGRFVAKRRKVRKGTRSCWECKRRKMRCIFESLAGPDSNCQGCRRRGSTCISQDLPMEFCSSGDAQPWTNIHDQGTDHGFPTPASTLSEHPVPLHTAPEVGFPKS